MARLTLSWHHPATSLPGRVWRASGQQRLTCTHVPAQMGLPHAPVWPGLARLGQPPLGQPRPHPSAAKLGTCLRPPSAAPHRASPCSRAWPLPQFHAPAWPPRVPTRPCLAIDGAAASAEAHHHMREEPATPCKEPGALFPRALRSHGNARTTQRRCPAFSRTRQCFRNARVCRLATMAGVVIWIHGRGPVWPT